MTEKQVQDLLAFARDKIAEELERSRVRTGNGVYSVNQKGSPVLFLDPPRKGSVLDAADEPWGVAIAGYTVSVSQGDITYPPPTPPNQFYTETTTDESVLLTASASGIRTNDLVDRVAFYQVQQPPASGFVLFRQTIYLRVISYSFPVRVTFQVVETPASGGPVTSTEILDFTSASTQPLEIVQTTDGSKTVSAIEVTRL